MGGYESAALCYFLSVVPMVAGVVMCARVRKWSHVLFIALWLLTVIRLGFVSLNRAGHNVPEWVRSEGTVFFNAFGLLVMGVMVVWEAWEYRQNGGGR